MRVSLINGGLGNQTFQYIFSKVIEQYTGEECILDDSEYFIGQSHNGYELDNVFSIKANLLSKKFSEDVWKLMIEQKKNGKDICQQLYDNGIDMFLVSEGCEYKFSGNSIIIPCNYKNDDLIQSVIKTYGNVYYYGYWIHRKWFDLVKDTIIKELTFPIIIDEKNKEYKNKIEQGKSISIHIRRGDMVDLGWALDEQFYVNAITYMTQKYSNYNYFVFSDDLKWCKDNEEKLGLNKIKNKITYIEGNEGKNSFRDLQLMSMCNKMIIANSSFSYLSAILNQNKDLEVINPVINREV